MEKDETPEPQKLYGSCPACGADCYSKSEWDDHRAICNSIDNDPE